MKHRLIKSALISLAIALSVVAVPLVISISEMMTYGYSFDTWFSLENDLDSRLEPAPTNLCDSKMFAKMQAGDIRAHNICMANVTNRNERPSSSAWNILSPSYSIWYYVRILIFVYIAAMVTAFGILSLIDKFIKKKR